MSTSKKEAWRRLLDPPTVDQPIGYAAKAVALRDTEFISSTRVIPGDKRINIMKYNVMKNQWTKWLELDSYNGPNYYAFDLHVLSMDTTQNKLFIFEGERGRNFYAIMIYDLTNNKWTKLNGLCFYSQGNHLRSTQSGILFVNGICHLFVALRENVPVRVRFRDSNVPKLQHFVLDEDAKQFVNHDEIDMDLQEGVSMFLFHISRLNSILLIQEASVGKHGEVWRFKLDANQWNKVQGVSLPIDITIATITSDEQRIVMADADNIFLLDISDQNDFKLFKSDVGIPVYSRSSDEIVESMIRMGSGVMNEKLVIGWTKRLLKEEAFQDLSLPPLYLLQMIALWVLDEEIHYLRRQYDYNESQRVSQMHFVISMKRILTSKLTRIECQDSSQQALSD